MNTHLNICKQYFSIVRILRITFCFVILTRFSLILHASNLIGFHENKIKYQITLFALCYVILVVICFFQFLNQKYNHTILFVAPCIVYLDYYFATDTLGTTVASMCSFALCTTNTPSITRRLKFIAFYGYAMSSFTALLYHLNDTKWCDGDTLSMIFQSSYLCRFHQFFLDLFDTFPTLTLLSPVGTILHSLFQLLIPLCFFNKYIYKFIKVWGWIFFITCFIFIELSYLPILEIILWLSIFHGRESLGLVKFRDKCFLLYTTLIILLSSFHFFFNFHIPVYGNIGNRFNISGSLANNFNFNLPNSYHLLKVIGLETPDVFNQIDLKMSNHWCVIERSKVASRDLIQIDKIKELTFEYVPFTKRNGSKDYYQYNDLVYQYKYGTCAYRRSLNHLDSSKIENFHDTNSSTALQHHKFLSSYDYAINNLDGKYLYRINLFKRKSINDENKLLFTKYLLLENNIFVDCMNTYFSP